MANIDTTAPGRVRQPAVVEVSADVAEMITQATSPPRPVLILRRRLHDDVQTAFKKVLDIVELACPDDRAWRMARKLILDILNDTLRHMAASVELALGTDPGQDKEER